MSAKRKLKKIPIVMILLVLCAAAFSQLPVFSEHALAPFVAAGNEDYREAEPSSEYPSDENQSGEYQVYEHDPNNYSITDSNTFGEAEYPNRSRQPVETREPAPPPAPPPIFIQLEYEDISRGSLILINRYNAFHFPSSHDLVLLSEFITQNSAVYPANQFLSLSVIPALNAMMDAFYAETGRSHVAIRSAFRGEEQQRRLFNQRANQIGRDEAWRWVALAGYSEHHAGLAFDFGIFRNGHMAGFTGTGVYSWFRQNAHYFGFILRYPAGRFNITRVEYEPWHFRYVGIPHAFIIHNSGFVLEEYIEFIRIRNQNYSYKIYIDNVLYEIFFTDDFEIELPAYSEFTISGNNIDGFIVTVIHRETAVEYTEQEYTEQEFTG